MAPRTLLFATALLTASVLPLIAQEKTATGYTMDWTRTLQERPDPFMNARHTLNGWSFMVYECSAGEAMGHWKKHMEKLGGTAKSSKPTRVTGAAIPGLASSPPFVFANAKKDASAGGVPMYIASAGNRPKFIEPMFNEHISGRSRSGAVRRCSTVML